MIDDKTYVFGHQNPDTDSICSAISYANLKNALGDENVAPGRLGELSNETSYVLEQFGFEPPKLLDNVAPQVNDLHYDPLRFVKENDSVLKALNIIVDAPGRSLPVVDDHNKLIGIVSLPDLINVVTTPYASSLLRDSVTPWENIKEIFQGQIETGEMPEYVTGEVLAGAQVEAGAKLKPEDVIVVSCTSIGLINCFQSGSQNIILCNLERGSSSVIPRGYEGMTMTTKYSPFEAMRLITQAIPVKNFVQKENIEYFVDYETLKDVKNNIETSKHHRFPVVNEEGEVLTMISGSNLMNYDKKKVILVDHNERSQSIKGIEDADVVEVIDHHRINEISSSAPLYMRLEPVGCTSTIVKEMYDEKGVEIPKNIAGLMLSAILSDTLIFNSPTTTARDVKAAEDLAKIAEVDIQEYGKKMLVAGSNIEDMTTDEILGADRKKFTMGDQKVTISQINTADLNGITSKLPELIEDMEIWNDTEGQDLYVLMITDLVKGGSELVIAGNNQAKKLARDAFEIDENENSKFFPGYFSRKKQVVPALMKVASAV